MKMCLIFVGGLMLVLFGCVIYDYVGGGVGSGYYYGVLLVEYCYLVGYLYGYGSGYYGGGYGYYGYGGGYGYFVYWLYLNYCLLYNYCLLLCFDYGNGLWLDCLLCLDWLCLDNNGGFFWCNMDLLGCFLQQWFVLQQCLLMLVQVCLVQVLCFVG